MTQIIDVDMKSLTNFSKFIAKAALGPRGMRYAESVLLNDITFDLRKSAGNVLEDRFMLRKPKFVKGRLRVSKATKDHLQATFGAVDDKERFTPLVEQERGTKAKRKNVASIKARGTKKGQIKQSARVKAGKGFKRSKRYTKMRSPRNRASAMLHHLSRINYKKPFVITDHPNMPDGLYRFGPGTKFKRKIVLLQEFESPSAQPRRRPWLKRSIDRAPILTPKGLQRAWWRAVRYSSLGQSRSF